MDKLNVFEAGILVFIQDNLRTPAGNAVMPLFSLVNEAGILAIITVLALTIWKKYRNCGMTAMLTLISEVLAVNVIIKPIVARVRPYDVNTALTILGIKPSDASFPSGHTGAAFAVAFAMLFTMPKKWGIPAIIVASLISLSRLYCGVHYPTDVLAALLIALVAAILMNKFVYPKITEFLKRKGWI